MCGTFRSLALIVVLGSVALAIPGFKKGGLRRVSTPQMKLNEAGQLVLDSQTQELKARFIKNAQGEFRGVPVDQCFLIARTTGKGYTVEIQLEKVGTRYLAYSLDEQKSPRLELLEKIDEKRCLWNRHEDFPTRVSDSDNPVYSKVTFSPVPEAHSKLRLASDKDKVMTILDPQGLRQGEEVYFQSYGYDNLLDGK